MNLSDKQIERMKIVGKSLWSGNKSEYLGVVCGPERMSVINFLSNHIIRFVNRPVMKEAVKTGENLYEEIQKTIDNLTESEEAEDTKILLKDLWMCFNYKDIIEKFSIYVDNSQVEITEEEIKMKLVKSSHSEAVHVLKKLEEIVVNYIEEKNFSNEHLTKCIYIFYLYGKKYNIFDYPMNNFEEAIQEAANCLTHKIFIDFDFAGQDGYLPEPMYINKKDIDKILKKNKFNYIFNKFKIMDENKFNVINLPRTENFITSKITWINDENYRYRFTNHNWKPYNIETPEYYILKNILKRRKNSIEAVNAEELRRSKRGCKKGIIKNNEELLEKLRKYKPENIRSLLFPYGEDYILRWDNFYETSYCNAINLMIKDDIAVSGTADLNEEELAEYAAEKIKEEGYAELPLSYLMYWTNNEEFVRKIPVYADCEDIKIENHNLVLQLKNKEDENAEHIIDVLKRERDKYINEENIPDEGLATGYYQDKNYSSKMLEILKKIGRNITHPVIRVIDINPVSLYVNLESTFYVHEKDIERICQRYKNLQFIKKMFAKENLNDLPWLKKYRDLGTDEYLTFKNWYDYESQNMHQTKIIMSLLTDFISSELVEIETLSAELLYRIDDDE